ncbi:MAG: hypothetical protein ACJKTH_00365 [Patescibacteria group bacterium UBA2163]
MFQDIGFVFKNPLRLKITNYFVRRPGEWGNAADVVATIGSTRAAVSRELGQLVRFGILTSRQIHGINAYAVNESDNLFVPLKQFLVTLATPTDKEIVEAFRGIRGLTMIVAAGFFLDETHSPAELLIVGKNPDEKRIAKSIKKLESLVALPIRYVVLDTEEFYNRRQAYDRMLRDLFEFKHRVVLDRGN